MAVGDVTVNCRQSANGGAGGTIFSHTGIAQVDIGWGIFIDRRQGDGEDVLNGGIAAIGGAHPDAVGAAGFIIQHGCGAQ